MKLVTHLDAVLLVLGAVSALPAHAQMTCNNSNLYGNYSITITGAILAGPLAGPVNGVNLTNFDGAGNLTSVDHVIINGAGAPGATWRPAVGTYSVNSNCTGQASFTYPDGESPGLTYFFVLTKFRQESPLASPEGNWQYAQIDIVVSTPGFNITAVGAKLL
jgi:hypothetical protein